MDTGKLLKVALPKGRLGEKVYEIFAAAGYPCDDVLDPNTRKLIFVNEQAGVCYFWVKPSDVSIYVERGAADIGVAGKDIILEYSPDVFELRDLHLGICRMCVAGKTDFKDNPANTLRVATKFPNIALSYYRRLGRDIDIINLHGSIELAPVLGLSDVIVDIVESGKTLKENGLVPLETIVPISARLIANRSAYQFKSEEINALSSELSKLI
ncbi:MAG: ATP phosphoribosyltransferase [Oscillospiraceae bacterium]|nr:ATP phosphoribosyltransferase [Oscillospiraceae bacterium]